MHFEQDLNTIVSSQWKHQTSNAKDQLLPPHTSEDGFFGGAQRCTVTALFAQGWQVGILSQCMTHTTETSR